MRARLRDKPVWLVALWLLGLLAFFRADVHGSDPIGYYSWLRAAVIDGTLDVAETWEHYRGEALFEGPELFVTTPTGYRHNHWAAGSALLWSPFYVLAHAGVLLANALGAGIPADGYSLPYVIAAGLASTVYALVGVLMLYHMARRYAPPNIAAGSVAAVWFGTPLVFYAFSNPLMSHANDAFIGIVYLFAWLRAREQPSARRRFWLGAAIGLATWIRTQNALLMLFPAAETLQAFRGGAAARARLATWLAQALPLAAGFAALFAPLMAFWKIVYGSWIVNTYAATQGDLYFQFTQPRLLETLFGTDRGLFLWTPLALVALFGVGLLWRADRRLTLLLAFNFCLTLYVTASLVNGLGASFGNRHFVSQTGFFGLGLAAFVDRLRSRLNLRALAALGVAFVAWNLLLMAQYIVELIPRAGPVDVGQMLVNQVRVIGVVLDRLGSLIAARFEAAR
jgi:hypothetical protein